MDDARHQPVRDFEVVDMRVTIQEVIDRLTESAPRIENTVDQLLFGEPDASVRGIVTTFLATHHVLRQAIALNANLVISHEGIFYSHRHASKIPEADSVYREKRRLIEEAGLAVYRCHDSVHRCQPDLVTRGLIRALGWESYIEKELPTGSILAIPKTTLNRLTQHVKNKLSLPFLRVTGDLSAECTRVGVLVGYRGGGQTAIPFYEGEGADVIITGEGPEWETPEYVRDAVAQGKKRAFIALGHAESEEPGMKYLAEILRTRFPGLPVHFVPETPVFRVI